MYELVKTGTNFVLQITTNNRSFSNKQLLQGNGIRNRFSNGWVDVITEIAACKKRPRLLFS